MSRKLPRSVSLLSCVVLSTATCEKGGTFDPLDNVPTGGMANPTPTPTVDLPACKVGPNSEITLPCKIDLSDLTADMVSCNGIAAAGPNGSGPGMTWHNPSGAVDKLQFGNDENGTLASGSCGMAAKDCTVRLMRLPAVWNSIPTSARVRLTYSQRYRFGDDLLFNSGNLDSTRLTLGVPQLAGRDLAIFTGSRKDGANPELHTTSLWFSLGTADRALSFTVRSRCANTLYAAAYWYIEKMTAEVLPALP